MSKKSIEKLFEYADSVNVAELLDEDELNKIANEVIAGFEEDERSSQEWRDNAEKALELTSLEREVKNYPMPNAANVKYPLITVAALQFTSRTLPELIKSGEVAKYKIIGNDRDGKKNRRGIRLKNHLNYQILEIMDDWMDSRDRLLMQLAVVGTVFTKTYYDPIEGVPKSLFIPYNEIIISNHISSLESADRVTHLLYLSERELIEHHRFGLFRELPEEMLETDESDTINAQELLEVHCNLDLDDDGYPEPYVVTIHRQSQYILRIAPRFNQDTILVNGNDEVMKIFGKNFFSDYHFIHDPSGGFLSFGFGTLMLDMNTTVNTILNQLIDSGRLANLQGGFIGSGLRMRAKTVDLEPGEWLTMEATDGNSLRQNIVPLQYHEPSLVLFQLLGTLIDSAKELTSTTEALTGTADTQNVSPNTLMALIQQGLKVFAAIQRRVFRGYKKEFLKIVDINKVHLDVNEYLEVIDPTIEELQEIFDGNGEFIDYKKVGVDVVPVADLHGSTEAERMARLQAEFSMGLQLAQLGGTNPQALAYNVYTGLQSENIDQLIAMPQQGPDKELIELQSKIDKTGKELELKDRELNAKLAEIEAKSMKMHAEAIKAIAEAEAAESGVQIQKYEAITKNLAESNKALVERQKLEKMKEQSTGDSSNEGKADDK